MIALLRRWLGGGAEAGAPLRGMRWVVVDCESSGTDPARDRLLSIGAVGVREGRIDHADSFGVVLKQPTPAPHDNILVHGISAEEQRDGRAPADALPEFTRFVGEGLPVAFHAGFDRALLERAIPGWRRRWLDLAELAPALLPRRAPGARALDDWLAALEIPNAGRHDALADAYATAQMLLVLIAEAERQGLRRAQELYAVARGRRWLG